MCSSCKPKAEKAFRTKRGDKLEFRLGKKEQQDVQTPSVSEERSSKRQRYVLPHLEDANLSFYFRRRFSAHACYVVHLPKPSNKQMCNSSFCFLPQDLLSYSTCAAHNLPSCAQTVCKRFCNISCWLTSIVGCQQLVFAGWISSEEHRSHKLLVSVVASDPFVQQWKFSKLGKDFVVFSTRSCVQTSVVKCGSAVRSSLQAEP